MMVLSYLFIYVHIFTYVFFIFIHIYTIIYLNIFTFYSIEQASSEWLQKRCVGGIFLTFCT